MGRIKREEPKDARGRGGDEKLENYYKNEGRLAGRTAVLKKWGAAGEKWEFVAKMAEHQEALVELLLSGDVSDETSQQLARLLSWCVCVCARAREKERERE